MTWQLPTEKAIVSVQAEHPSTQIWSPLAEACSVMNARLCVVHSDWSVLYVNPAALQDVQCRPEEVIGLPLIECFPGIADTPFHRVLKQCMLDRSRGEYFGPLGRGHSAAYHDSRIQPCGEGLAILSLDSTYGLQALRRSQELLTLGRMSMGIAYQVKTILNSLGLARSLAERRWQKGQDLSDLFAKAQADLDRGSALAERLALFARGGTPTRPQLPISVNDIVRDAIGICEAALLQAPHAISVELELEATRELRMPIPPLLACVVEILINAIDALADGGRIIVRTGSQNSRVWIEVEDDGPGMSTEVESRAFEPLFTTKAGRANGLGLWMVRDFAEEQEGRVELRTSLGRGTLARIELPAVCLATPW